MFRFFFTSCCKKTTVSPEYLPKKKRSSKQNSNCSLLEQPIGSYIEQVKLNESPIRLHEMEFEDVVTSNHLVDSPDFFVNNMKKTPSLVYTNSNNILAPF